jgi:hypothetical protein
VSIVIVRPFRHVTGGVRNPRSEAGDRILNVRVVDSILWVDTAAFPLGQIASVAPYDCCRQVPAWHKVNGVVLIGVYSLAVLFTPPIVVSVNQHSLALDICGAGLVALGALFAFLYVKGTVPARYVFWHEVRISVIGTAGVTLAMWDPHILTANIAASIADPRAVFAMQVQNLNIEAINTTHGANSPIGS